jgi:hypothetical protein
MPEMNPIRGAWLAELESAATEEEKARSDIARAKGLLRAANHRKCFALQRLFAQRMSPGSDWPWPEGVR